MNPMVESNQLMVNCWFGLVVWIPKGSPYERDCYLGVPRLNPKPPTQTNNSPLVEVNNQPKKQTKDFHRFEHQTIMSSTPKNGGIWYKQTPTLI